MTVGDGLLELRIVLAKPLFEARPPIAPPPHPHEIIRGRQNKKNRKQDVIKDSHYPPQLISAPLLTILLLLQSNSSGRTLLTGPIHEGPEKERGCPHQMPSSASLRRL